MDPLQGSKVKNRRQNCTWDPLSPRTMKCTAHHDPLPVYDSCFPQSLGLGAIRALRQARYRATQVEAPFTFPHFTNACFIDQTTLLMHQTFRKHPNNGNIIPYFSIHSTIVPVDTNCNIYSLYVDHAYTDHHCL